MICALWKQALRRTIGRSLNGRSSSLGIGATQGAAIFRRLCKCCATTGPTDPVLRHPHREHASSCVITRPEDLNTPPTSPSPPTGPRLSARGTAADASPGRRLRLPWRRGWPGPALPPSARSWPHRWARAASCAARPAWSTPGARWDPQPAWWPFAAFISSVHAVHLLCRSM